MLLPPPSPMIASGCSLFATSIARWAAATDGSGSPPSKRMGATPADFSCPFTSSINGSPASTGSVNTITRFHPNRRAAAPNSRMDPHPNESWLLEEKDQ